MVTKFKLFEAGDWVKYNRIINNKKVMIELSWENTLSYPFIIPSSDKDSIYFGRESTTHGGINYDVFNIPDIQGRIWLEYKVIGFWDLKTENISKELYKIQNYFNTKYKSLSKSNVEDYVPIDFFDGEWKISASERSFNLPANSIVPLLDYIKTHDKLEIYSEEDEEYKAHLARVKNKNNNDN